MGYKRNIKRLEILIGLIFCALVLISLYFILNHYFYIAQGVIYLECPLKTLYENSNKDVKFTSLFEFSYRVFNGHSRNINQQEDDKLWCEKTMLNYEIKPRIHFGNATRGIKHLWGLKDCDEYTINGYPLSCKEKYGINNK